VARHEAATLVKWPTGIAEIDRDVETLGGRPELIDPEVQVRLTLRVSGIAAGGNPPADLYAISLSHHYAALFEVPVERHGAILVLDQDVVVLAGVLLRAGVGQVVPRPADNAAPGGCHVAAYRKFKIVRELIPMSPVRIAV